MDKEEKIITPNNSDVTGNISKKRREELIGKIEEIRSFLESSGDANARHLVAFASELEKEIRHKKYGLVFEEHKERIDIELEKNLPVLTEIKERFIDNGGDVNFLIEGDNLAALKLLEKTHRGKIDVIYIDPPYNTGNNDFIYNDNIIEVHDLYKHSKWISFMTQRLKIAKELLSREGVIFISIDDNEQAPLKILCDAIFSESNFVGVYFWKRTNTPPALSLKIRRKMEYVLCYQRNDIKRRKFFQGLADGDDAPLLNSGNPTSVLKFPVGKVKFKISDGTYGYTEGMKIKLINPVIVKDGYNKNEFMAEAHFKWGQEYLNEEINNGTYFIIKSTKFSIRYQRALQSPKTPSNIIDLEVNVGTNEEAQKELESVSIRFDYAKPTSLISYLLKMPFADKKDINVLDFFAGSGTTGHAVMKLNANSEGNRKFILVTNNENGICENVTYERLRRVIEKENYRARLKYFKIEMLPIEEKLYYEYADDLLKHIRELVELENAVDFSHDNSVAIILAEDELADFFNSSERISACKSVYIGQDVLLNSRSKDKIMRHNILLKRIPKYYYPEKEG